MLFSGCSGDCVQSDLYVVDIEADAVWLLIEDAISGRYLPSGHLFYTGIVGGGYAAPFDLESLRLTGGAIPVLEDVVPGYVVLSRSGTILYVRNSARPNVGSLVLVDRNGDERSIAPDWTGQFGHPTLTPDGQTLAVSLAQAGVEDIWTRPLDRGPASKMTPGDAIYVRPEWSGDGSKVMYVSDRSGDLSMRAADGSGGETTVLDVELQINEVQYGPGDEWIVLRMANHIYSKRVQDDADPVKLFGSDFNERTPTISPDGRWLAYVSDLSGTYEVYVSPFPNGDDGRWAVSIGGGEEPQWSRNGGELFFKSRGMLMSAAVIQGTEFRNEPPQPLFSVRPYLGSQFHPFYDVTPDGQFLMVRSGNGASTDGDLILVENWFEELKAKMGN